MNIIGENENVEHKKRSLGIRNKFFQQNTLTKLY